MDLCLATSERDRSDVWVGVTEQIGGDLVQRGKAVQEIAKIFARTCEDFFFWGVVAVIDRGRSISEGESCERDFYVGLEHCVVTEEGA